MMVLNNGLESLLDILLGKVALEPPHLVIEDGIDQRFLKSRQLNTRQIRLIHI